MAVGDLTSLKVGVGWIELDVVSEADVILNVRGYAPILRVRKKRTGVEYFLYISAKSLADPLEDLRQRNGGLFKGLHIRVRKQSGDRMSKYEIESISS